MNGQWRQSMLEKTSLLRLAMHYGRGAQKEIEKMQQRRRGVAKDLTNVRYIVRHVTEQAIAFMDKRGWPLDDEEKFSTVCGFMLGMLYAHVKQPAKRKTAPRKEGKNDWASELVKTESGYIWAVRIVKRAKRLELHGLRDTDTNEFLEGYEAACVDILAALTKGRA